MPILTVNNLCVRMGVQEILRGVNIKIEKNGIVAVLGSNGVGKTTLMRAISNIYESSEGEILFRRQDIANIGSDKVVKLGVCQAPEGRQIFSNMTVEENLILGAYHQEKKHFKGDLDKIFELFPIVKERLRQKAGAMSGGEQQMLCIGRALMGRPKLLLLDEPSLGLAPLIIKDIFDLIKKIREAGTAILIVEQNAKAALSVADYGYIMEGGSILMEGPAAELASSNSLEAAYLGGKVHG
ncbi:ABC transporter ATP-binding protein [Desulfovibrio gilichinskyi]|uniref:Amino acid/amide ABC transporter ATP-binding protein 2, HAAT family n=1 Tax=Desulfovibrio gilichinskyi TaxID=1519643 RepID=A0A1X7E8D0_9BACT|nr:ABC transporter ATP-binding protein [Desulfovibrio gilichinskyi]SMF29048.1 amino acid/amide ABC transporter ATP-binding protein 2, HAAT family [Desulfovibrio gilichinskyi]